MAMPNKELARGDVILYGRKRARRRVGPAPPEPPAAEPAVGAGTQPETRAQ